MADLLRPVVVTTPTRDEYIRAVLRGWHLVGDGVRFPREESIAVLWAQYMIETGGRSCFGWNLGNVKASAGQPYHQLRGVWEGVTPADAERLEASGEAVRDTNENHAKAVGASRVSVVFQPPHPATHFRAFDSLDAGMAEHLELLHRRFSKAWPSVLAGDFVAFAQALHDQHYFTAAPEAYAAGMRNPFGQLVASNTYEDAILTMHVPAETEALELVEDAYRYDWAEELANLVSVAHQGASGLIVDDMMAAFRRD